MIRTVHNKNNAPIATLDVQQQKVIISEIFSTDPHDLDYIATVAFQYQHEIDEALRQKAHDAQQREIEAKRLARIAQKEREAQAALEAFEALQSAPSNITYHLSDVQRGLVLDYTPADKSNYMDLAIDFAKSLDHIAVLVSDHYFSEKQRNTLNRFSHSRLRIISLAEVHNGSYEQMRITHDLLIQIYEDASLLLQSPYFATLAMSKSFKTLSFLHHDIAYTLHLGVDRSRRFFVSDTKRNRKDTYLRSTYHMKLDVPGGIQEMIAQIGDIVHLVEVQYRVSYGKVLDLLPKDLLVRIDNGLIALEKKGSPIALLVNLRQDDITIEVGSAYTLNRTSYTLSVNTYPTYVTRRYPLSELSTALKQFEVYRPFNTFRNYKGFLLNTSDRYDVVVQPVIEYLIGMNNPRNTNNRFIQGDDDIKIIPLVNIYK